MSKATFLQRIVQNKKLFYGILGFIIACLIPLFIHSPYYLDLIIMILVKSMLAISFIVTLNTGLINMSVPSFYGLGAYISAVLVAKLGLSFWLSLPLTVCLILVVSLGLGYLMIGSTSSGLNFVMLTMVVGMSFPVLIGNIDYVGGYNGMMNVPIPGNIDLPLLPPIVFDEKTAFFYLILILFFIVILVITCFNSSSLGRAWKAVGLNPRLAESIGVDLFKYKILSYCVASAICGLAGCFYTHYQTFLSPESFNMWQNMYVQMYAVLGGIGYPIIGPIIGSAIMTFLPEMLRLTQLLAPLITGILLILLILFIPRGLLGLFDTNNPGAGRIIEIIKRRVKK